MTTSDLLNKVKAGLLLFFTTSYLLFILPSFFIKIGIDKTTAISITILSIAIPTLIAGVLVKRPIVFGPGVALTAYLTLEVVGKENIPYEVVAAAVVVEGIILLALSISKLRETIIKALPNSIVEGTTAGIGIYLITLAFENFNFIEGYKISINPTSIIGFTVLFLSILFILRNSWGGFLIAIIIGYIMSIAFGKLSPTLNLSMPKISFIYPSFSTDGFSLLSIVLAILLIDFFDTLGVAAALTRGKLQDKELKNILLSDSVGTITAGFIGAPSVIAYIESTTVPQHIHSMVPSLVCGALFLLSLFFYPFITSIPSYISYPVLAAIGSLMFISINPRAKEVDDIIPMVFTTSLIPITKSIATGIMVGIFTYIVTKLLSGKTKEIHPALVVITILILLDIINVL